MTVVSFQRAMFPILLMALALPVQAEVGTGSSGGGAAIVCRTSKGKIKRAFLYDLYEAENDSLHPLTIIRSNDSVDIQIDKALKRWKALEKKGGYFEGAFDAEIATLRNALALVKRDWSPLKAGTRLPFVPDVNPTIMPKDPSCKLETMAHYWDSKNTLKVDLEIYAMLSPTDKAALQIHEGAYKANRLLADEANSENTRRMVARLFAKEAREIRFAKSLAKLSDLESELLKSGDSEEQSEVESEGFTKRVLPIDFAIADLLFGGKALVCRNPRSTEVPKEEFSLFFKKKKDAFVISEDEANEDDSPLNSVEDGVYLQSRGAGLAWAYGEVRPFLSRDLFPGDRLNELYLDLSSGDSNENSAIKVPLRELWSEAVYSRSQVMRKSLYVYRPERGGDIIDAPLECQLR
jgi:hypothetical protein